MPNVETKRITDFTPDGNNANRGTERGLRVLDDSLREVGAGRSILVDRKGRIIAGNKTHERAVDIGLNDVIVVHTDGHQLVVVQRDDLDLDTHEGRRMAILDNRASEVGLDWSPTILAQLQAEDPTLTKGLWTEDELAEVLREVPDVEFKEYDESVENEVEYITCPKCGHKWPK